MLSINHRTHTPDVLSTLYKRQCCKGCTGSGCRVQRATRRTGAGCYRLACSTACSVQYMRRTKHEGHVLHALVAAYIGGMRARCVLGSGAEHHQGTLPSGAGQRKAQAQRVDRVRQRRGRHAGARAGRQPLRHRQAAILRRWAGFRVYG